MIKWINTGERVFVNINKAYKIMYEEEEIKKEYGTGNKKGKEFVERKVKIYAFFQVTDGTEGDKVKIKEVKTVLDAIEFIEKIIKCKSGVYPVERNS